jgi:hypothetical protein
MPTIAWFYGIMIQMYYNDHEPPHFHARYGGGQSHRAVVGWRDNFRRTASYYGAVGPRMGSGAKRRIAG